MENINRFSADDFYKSCQHLAAQDPYLQKVLDLYGPPPMWTRPNSFETLVLTILEQQVSLAAAYAAYTKLKEQIIITPENLLALSDETLRSCYFTRQKIVYTRLLAEAIINKEVDLAAMESWPDDAVRNELKKRKGIGDWTVDIYLIHVLQRSDVFPLGDLALVNGIRMLLEDALLTKEQIATLAEKWRPFRSIATMMVWHFYIKKKNIKIVH